MALQAEQSMWVAYLGEIRRVTIVEKGTRGMGFKVGKRPKDPYIVYDEMDEEEFVMASADLHHNPRDAQIAAAELAREHGVQLPAPEKVNPVEPEEEEGEDAAEEEEDEEEEEEDQEEEEDDDDDLEQEDDG